MYLEFTNKVRLKIIFRKVKNFSRKFRWNFNDIVICFLSTKKCFRIKCSMTSEKVLALPETDFIHLALLSVLLISIYENCQKQHYFPLYRTTLTLSRMIYFPLLNVPFNIWLSLIFQIHNWKYEFEVMLINN